MLSPQKMNRLNELARRSKAEELTEVEKKEQQQLREEYLQTFRKGFRDQLDHIEIVDDESTDIH